MFKYLTLLFLFLGCAHNPELQVEEKKPTHKGDDLSWISNEDFKYRPVKYRKSDDYIPQDLFSERDRSLFKGETLKSFEGENAQQVTNSSSNTLLKVSILCRQKKFLEARVGLRDLHKRYKKNPAFWNQVGVCFLLEGRDSLAGTYLNRAREIDPRYAPVYNNLGVYLMKQGRYPDAYHAFKKSHYLSPYAHVPVLNMGLLLVRSGRPDDVFKFLRPISRQEERPALLYKILGYAHFLKEEYGQSVSYYKEYTKTKNVQDASWKFQYAYGLMKIGRRDDARSISQQLSPSNSGERKMYQSIIKGLL